MVLRMRVRLTILIMATVLTFGVSVNAEDTSTELFGKKPNRLGFSTEKWAQNDNCGKQSFQKYSDYTVQGGIQRDAYMRDCLRRHHIAPRNDLMPRNDLIKRP